MYTVLEYICIGGGVTVDIHECIHTSVHMCPRVYAHMLHVWELAVSITER